MIPGLTEIVFPTVWEYGSQPSGVMSPAAGNNIPNRWEYLCSVEIDFSSMLFSTGEVPLLQSCQRPSCVP